MRKLIYYMVLGVIIFKASYSNGQALIVEPFKLTKGTLIMSDSPECVNEEGILYQENVKGKGRLLFHHVKKNSSNTEANRLIVMVENKSKEPQVFSIGKCVVKGPSPHILYIGQQLLVDYFNSKTNVYYLLDACEKRVIYDSIGSQWKQEEVISGLMDFYVKEEVQLTVIMSNTSEDDVNFLDLTYLERDKEPRGTFNCLEKHYKIELPEKGASYISFEDNDKAWAKGTDGITQEERLNIGNYGIMYHITLKASADTQISINPRGGVFCGAIQFDGENPIEIKREHYFKQEKESVIIGTILAHETKELYYMLPNGSAAPVRFIFQVMCPE